jgi:predicted TIM-barrel fold metal-dependent hydrolase
MIITDSGSHIWRAASPDNPWMPGRKAHFDTPIGYEDLRRMMAEAGVHRHILIPPSWEGDRADYSLEAAAKYPDQFAVMGRVPLQKAEEGRRMLESWKQKPGMLGVRLTFHHAWDESWITDGTADWFWPLAERLNIPVMMNVPSVLPEVGKVAARHPNLRIILDHMGRLRGMKDATFKLDKSIELAKNPNVHVKLTLLQECTSDPYPYRNIQPEVRRLIDAFSPRRTFWGTDLSALLSRSPVTYRQAVTMFTEEMGLSQGDLEWIMGRAISECLPWPVAPSLLRVPQAETSGGRASLHT